MKFIIGIFVFVYSGISLAIGVDDLLGGFQKPKECRNLVEIRASSLANLVEQAKVLKINRQYCEAIAYFSKIMSETISPDQYGWAWSQRIESAFYSYDYATTIGQSEQFLIERPNSKYEKSVRFTLIKAIYELASENFNSMNPWFQFALGVHLEQLSGTSPKGIYSLQSYLDRYSQDENTHLVMAWQQGLQMKLDSQMIQEARMSRLRRDYVPAIIKYQLILKRGPLLENFDVGVFELIQTLNEFAFEVENPRVVPDRKLAIWLMKSENQITSEDRAVLKTQLDRKARELYLQMQKEIPKSPWAVKARQEFSF